MSRYIDYTAEQVRNLLWLMIENRREARKGKYRSQAELAIAIGVSAPYLNDILLRKREPQGKVLEFLGLERNVSYRRVLGDSAKAYRR